MNLKEKTCKAYIVVQSMCSGILNIIGLIFECSSFVYMGQGIAFLFMSKEKRKAEYLLRYTTIDEGLERVRSKWLWGLVLLLVGLVLQAIAGFL